MKNSVFRLLLLTCLLLLTSLEMFAQDSLAVRSTDSIPIDTVVIRTNQYPVRIVPRGVSLINPVISFKATKPLTQKLKRFRVPSFWEKINEFDFQLSEVAFVNWNAGGDNAVSANAKLYFARNYKFRYFQWDNDLELRFGWNAQEGRQWRKTDDAIRFSSTLGYRRDTISEWYYSAKLNFNTQFADGFKYPDRSTPISRFMAPGYVFAGAGTSYIQEGKKFNLYLSPLTFKGTFVLDEALSNAGAFGVKRAVRDADGNIISPGERVFSELGILINHKWEFPFRKNISANHNLSLYTDYIRGLGNIDVDWQLTLKFIVNEFISASIFVHTLYDDDILFDEEIADDGTVLNPGIPKIQFRQQLGIGINYIF